jgi:hypothetical protein
MTEHTAEPWSRPCFQHRTDRDDSTTPATTHATVSLQRQLKRHLSRRCRLGTTRSVDPQQTSAVVFSLRLPRARRALVRGYRGWLQRSVLTATIDFDAPVGGPESGTAGLARPSNLSANETERFNVLSVGFLSHLEMIATT